MTDYYRVPAIKAGSRAELHDSGVFEDDGHTLDGAAPQQDNIRRASFALAALDEYRSVCRGDDLITETIQDFLSDLTHLLDACVDPDGESVSIGGLLDASANHYEAEIRGEL